MSTRATKSIHNTNQFISQIGSQENQTWDFITNNANFSAIDVVKKDKTESHLKTIERESYSILFGRNYSLMKQCPYSKYAINTGGNINNF